MISLRLKEELAVPLEAEAITSDGFQDKSLIEIANLPVIYGNQAAKLGDFFEIKPNGTDEVRVEGDLDRVKYIGSGMKQGNLVVEGNAGMHLGANMRGGKIVVHGNVGDWAGAEMRGGIIHIWGNAGHALGGAYRGSPRGMNKGVIMVNGNAGSEVGATMRRGLIVIGGNTGEFTGAFLIAGTIFVFGKLGERAGAGLKRGTIVTFQQPTLLPTYVYDCVYKPAFLRLVMQNLRSLGWPIQDEHVNGYYRRYSGDINALGKGEILVYDQR